MFVAFRYIAHALNCRVDLLQKARSSWAPSRLPRSRALVFPHMRANPRLKIKATAEYFNGVFGDNMPNAIVTGLNSSDRSQPYTIVPSHPVNDTSSSS